MQLCTQDVIDQGFVTTSTGESPVINKNCSFDLTIGKILKKTKDGGVKEYNDKCLVQPQETVYLISSEILHIKEKHTAYVFLKNRLSQEGILAFNTGLIDEKYNGCISTLITNLSSLPIEINIGKEFFRLVIHKYTCVSKESKDLPDRVIKIENYIENRKKDLSLIPESFLNRDKIKEEINEELKSKIADLSINKLMVYFAILGVFFAIFLPWFNNNLVQDDKGGNVGTEEVLNIYRNIEQLVASQKYMQKDLEHAKKKEAELASQLLDYKIMLDLSLEKNRMLESRLDSMERAVK